MRPFGARAPAREPFVPAWVTEVDVEGGIPALEAPARPDGSSFGRARVLVRSGGRPLGFVALGLDGGRAGAEALAQQLGRHGLAAEPTIEPSGSAPTPQASVVVCTRDRPASLRGTLESLVALRYPAFEVVVVDNSPTTSATRDLVEDLGDPRMRYVLEPRPGLSRARNRGVHEANGEIVAFTDDDVIVDPGWLVAIAGGFARAPHVGLVTGLIAPAELETESQAYFDAKLDWSELFEPHLYDMGAHRPDSPVYPYSAGRFGAGANFAVSRSAFGSIGPFDAALGAGTPSRGGEDLDYFLRTVLSGHAIAYEPAALVWHLHRREAQALVAQMYGYGSGLTAYIFKHLISTPRTAVELLRRVPISVIRFATASGETQREAAAPDGAQHQELRGLLAGPLLYLRGRSQVRRDRTHNDAGSVAAG